MKNKHLAFSKTETKTIKLKLDKERACLEDECSFCEKPFKPNDIMWVANEPIVMITICKECLKK